MKNRLYILLVFGLIPVLSFSQQKKEVKTSVEVKVVKENEETKVVIRTNEDGKVKEEVFRGEEAEKKAEEIRGRYKVDEADDKKVEVRVEIINGQKVMTVSETTGDKVSVKVYQGDEVDEKLKEMDIKEPAKQKQ